MCVSSMRYSGRWQFRQRIEVKTVSKDKAQSPQEKKVKQSRDKAAKFKELANKRTNKALRSIEGLGALSNRNSYTFDDTQVAKIFAALQTTLDAAKKKYSDTGSGGGFSL